MSSGARVQGSGFRAQGVWAKPVEAAVAGVASVGLRGFRRGAPLHTPPRTSFRLRETHGASVTRLRISLAFLFFEVHPGPKDS